MENVRIKVMELKQIVETNRQEHAEVVEEAIEDYRQKVIAQMKENLADAESGKEVKTKINLVEPKSYISDYDTVLKMLELTVDDVVQLNSYAFRQYVMDEWEWSDNWKISNTMYSRKLRAG